MASKAGSSKRLIPQRPPNFVHSDSIHRETINKELALLQLRTSFFINPYQPGNWTRLLITENSTYVKEHKKPHGPPGDADLRFRSPQPDTSLYCETTDTGLVHRVVCLFTSQPKQAYPFFTDPGERKAELMEMNNCL